MMVNRSVFILKLALISCNIVWSQNYALVIHGGAGFASPETLTEEAQNAYQKSLKKVLLEGQRMLESGESSLTVVENVIRLMEDDSLFNAGRGSVFNQSGQVECDASIMNGADKNAGSVSGVMHLKNPISTARLVMEKSPHVMLSGSGAEEFALLHKQDLVPNNYLHTTKAFNSYKAQLMKKKHGTVGAVALDQDGHIAAGTSTGGMSGKAFGRIGDAPIIGAGTYADDNTCGISCTGHGEYFIRHAVAHSVSAMMEYGNKSIEDASQHIIFKTLNSQAGAGGLIGIDKSGQIVMEFNTTAMFRGYVNQDDIMVAIFKDK